MSDLVSLQSLDLSDNPLAVAPVVLGMKALRELNLSNTGISHCPIGIADEPFMTSLDLRHNRISRVPQAILNQAVSRDRVWLWDNPLTDEETLSRLVDHRERTGINLWLSQPGEGYGSASRGCKRVMKCCARRGSRSGNGWQPNLGRRVSAGYRWLEPDGGFPGGLPDPAGAGMATAAGSGGFRGVVGLAASVRGSDGRPMRKIRSGCSLFWRIECGCIPDWVALGAANSDGQSSESLIEG